MGVAEKKFIKIIIFSHINAPFTLLPSRNGARFLMRYNEPFPYFYHFRFAGKIPFCIFLQLEIRGKENTRALEWEKQFTCRHLVTGLDP